MSTNVSSPSPPRQRLTRDESQAQTRDRLLEAARCAFARLGYTGASVDVIVTDAGYTKGAFYSNFPSKEAIFLELLRRHMASEATQLDQLLSASIPLEAVLAHLDQWFADLNQDADWALLAVELQLQARRSPNIAAAYNTLFAQHRQRLGELVATLFSRSGKQLPAAAEDIAGALMATAHGLALQTNQPEAAALVGPIIRLLLRGLLASAPPTQPLIP